VIGGEASEARSVGPRTTPGAGRLAWLVATLLSLAPGFSHAAGPPTCPPGDLLRLEGVQIASPDASTWRSALGGFLPEGSESGRDQRLEAPLTIDLGVERTLRALMLQAEHDDVYLVEGSEDGASWTRLALAREVEGPGLRSRPMRLSRPAQVRLLRVSGSGGDGRFALSGLSAWCQVPEQPPSPPVVVAGSWRDTIPAVQLALAVLGLLLFGQGLVLHKLGRPDALRRGRDTALAVLGVLAGLAWWNFGGFHSYGYVHRWEQFHYFLGAKYFAELDYTRLYTCVTVADLEEGLDRQIGTRRVRDMETNRAGPAGTIAADPGRCTQHFTDARWTSFKSDVAWFRAQLPPEVWERIFLDHGYNAPPAWGMLGGTLTRHLPATDGSILALSLLDPALLILTGIAVVWAFGWRTLCVALLWWGTNRMAGFGWTGGGLLRQDWLLLSVLGICLVRRGHAAGGGMALGYAALLRVFPGLIVVALILQAIARSLRARRVVLEREQLRLLLGVLTSVVVLLPLSAATSGGFAAWGAFVDNARANTRATGVNTVGLMSALCYDPALRQATFVGTTAAATEDERREAKRDLLTSRRPVHWLLLAAFLVLLARAVRDEKAWVSLALGVGLIPVGVFLASYYYSVLLIYGLLWRRWGDAVGALLCALSVATHITARLWPAPIQMDTRFAWNSIATVAMVLAVTIMAWRTPIERKQA
jgi:hypothetical protein